MGDKQQTEDWVSACLRKKRLKEDWADQIIARAAQGGNYLRKYPCPHCLHWHVTSKKAYGRYKENQTHHEEKKILEGRSSSIAEVS